MTAITKKNEVDAKHSLAILCSDFKNKSAYNLTKEQIAYISDEIKENDKKFISINALSRLIIVILVDPKKNHYSALESIRKHGATITDMLNANKLTSIQITNELSNPDYSLALTEGLSLANYQFIKHKPSAKKEKNTLTSIVVVDAKITNTHLSNLSIAIDATLKARDLVNEPVNSLNATDLANAFKAMGKEAGFKVDIYNKSKKEENINPEDILLEKEPNEDDKPELANEKDFDEDESGSDLDVPGAELDDEQEKIGSEDEENNYYSLGGDNHNDLEEDRE